MKIINSTDWPDYTLRRMISWICGKLEIKVSDVQQFKLRNRSDGFNSGRCWSEIGRIVVSLGVVNTEKDIFTRGEVYRRFTIDKLVSVTAHEIAHRALWIRGAHTRFSRRFNRVRRGSSEAQTENYEREVLREFIADKETLLAQWLAVPERVACKASESVIEKREKKARADLERWQRKLKIATNKVRKLKARVKYYDRNKNDSLTPKP